MLKTLVLTGALFAFALAGPAPAQTSEFAKPEELTAAYKQNETKIDNLSKRLDELNASQQTKKAEINAYAPVYSKAVDDTAKAHAEWVAMRDSPAADMDSTLAWDAAKRLERVYLDKLTALAQVDAKKNGLIDEYKGLQNTEAATWQNLINAQKRKMELMGQQEFFNPPFLKDIKVIRANPVSHKDEVLYHKTWVPGDDYKLLQLNIENHLMATEDVAKMIEAAEKQVAYKRKLFVDAYNTWTHINNAYADKFYDEAYARIYLEFIDVAVGTKAGTNAPAVLYELLYRGGEALRYAVTHEGFEYQIPKLSDDYANLIKKLGAAVDGGREAAKANGRASNLVDTTVYGDSFVWGTAQDVGMEMVKSAGGLTVGSVAEAMTQRELAEDMGWWALVATNQKAALQAYKDGGGSVFEKMSDLRRHMFSGGETLGDLWSRTIKSGEFWKSAGIDAAKAALLTIGKDVIYNQLTQSRFDTYRNLATAEIDWFIRRNDYNAAMWFREEQKANLRKLYEELGVLYAQKEANCCSWKADMSEALDIATSQAGELHMITVSLIFSEPMHHEMTASLSSQTKILTAIRDSFNDTVFTIPVRDLLDNPEDFEGGKIALALQGKSKSDEAALDTNPATQAVYKISTGGWRDYEADAEGDKTTELNFVKPSVSVDAVSISSKPAQVPVKISFKSVNSFVKEAAVAIFPAQEHTWHDRYKEFPHQVLNGRLDGDASLTVSLAPGDYEARLDDGFGNDAAVAKLTVGKPGFLVKAKVRGEDATADLLVKPQ